MGEDQNNSVIISDLIGGAIIGVIIAWEDRRNDINGGIYADKGCLTHGQWRGSIHPTRGLTQWQSEALLKRKLG